MSLPVIPYSAFCTLVGAELSREAEHRLSDAGVAAVVLCADEAGQRCVLLTVGEGQECKTLDDADKCAPEGLSPFCAVRAEERLLAANRAGSDKELARRDAALAERERAVAELERKNAELEARVAEALRSLRRK